MVLVPQDSKMITVIYSTHKDNLYNTKFKQHLEKTIGIKNFEILEFQNNNQYSLAEVYNLGISQSKNNIVVCCHNDIKLENGWGKKLLSDFELNSDYAIIGKAGSCYFPESGIYWEKLQQTMVGQVYHYPPNQKKFLSKYSPKLPFLIPVVTIDGLFISFDKTKIKHLFDETIGKFHFYDHGFCIPNYLEGIKIGVTSSFEITHESVGRPNEEFFISKDKFVEKYKDSLPINLLPNKPYVDNNKPSKIKNYGKVAVIIPTKGKINILLDCLNSYVDHCVNENFEIFIADTGSTDDEKNIIKNYITEKKDIIKINLIEYDYYKFSKINNDVIKNYIDDSFEYILFSNNDIVLLNNVILNLVSIFKTHHNTGTAGCRLHYFNNIVQHNGVAMGLDKNNKITFANINRENYYNYVKDVNEVVINTATLMMIRKNTFTKLGMFNEEYDVCFEDVELNLKCLQSGLKNYNNGNAVAYHSESITRNDDINKNIIGTKLDLLKIEEYVIKHLNKLSNYIHKI